VALNQCQKFGKWILDNGEYEGLTTWINSYFWAKDKTICKVSYFSIGSNYKGTYCGTGAGSGDESMHAIVIG